MTSERIKPRPKRSVGRPRRLSLDEIVDAACRIGIGNLDMAVLAERLNTGVGTLYGYVRGREHLLELVAGRLAAESLVEERGQSWQDLMREHAAVTAALFQTQPQLITNLIAGSPDEKVFVYSQNMMDRLTQRGLAEGDAASLFTEVNQVVIGAAICLERRKLLVAKCIDENGHEPLLPDVFGDHRPTLELVLAAQERRMRPLEPD